MANQSVSTPRFFVDFSQLLKLKGFYESTTDDKVFNGDLYDGDYYNLESQNYYFELSNMNEANEGTFSKLLGICNWGGFFNHEIYKGFINYSAEIFPSIKFNDTGANWEEVDLIEIINGGGTGSPIAYDGFTIFEFVSNLGLDIAKISIGLDSAITQTSADFYLGSGGFGRYYDITNSADLNIRKSIKYDGVDIKRTLGGSDIAEIKNWGVPNWVSGEPWALNKGYSKGRIGRNGRRSWDLSFSYISNDDLFFDNTSLTKLNSFADLDSDPSDTAESANQYSASTEIQQIFDLTLGGALSFYFTPDKDATNPEFAQCKLDQNSLEATQVAHQTWNISMRIVEVW